MFETHLRPPASLIQNHWHQLVRSTACNAESDWVATMRSVCAHPVMGSDTKLKVLAICRAPSGLSFHLRILKFHFVILVACQFSLACCSEQASTIPD